MSIEGQGHFLTLAQGHVHTKIQTGFPQKILCWSEPNFVWKLSSTRKWKSDDMMLVTLPRWPPCPYMVKPFKNLLRNRQADFHETWYVPSGAPVHHNLFKWWPLSDLDLFYGKVKFGYLCFSMGRSEYSGFFRNYLKVGRFRQLIEIMKLCEYWRSRSFLYHIFSRFCMFCALLTSRYQVSVYRTNGPLVYYIEVRSDGSKWHGRVNM